eukprot:TRINITY_DN1315_c0_g2_i1.p1 TRINITY_DN1315_c0_g2~~TRINITY_DN1315_c0_g2_i1.p1  ORF type:complete len:209 (+),score=43.11 TRINITY_DN1315_c0_g2_i1:156-782(+)
MSKHGEDLCKDAAFTFGEYTKAQCEILNPHQGDGREEFKLDFASFLNQEFDEYLELFEFNSPFTPLGQNSPHIPFNSDNTFFPCHRQKKYEDEYSFQSIEQKDCSVISPFSDAEEGVYSSVNSPTYHPDFLASLELQKKRIFSVHKVSQKASNASSVSITSPHKETPTGKLTPQERAAKILKYKGKKRVWKQRQKRKKEKVCVKQSEE